eukprot:2397630-Amphidinium_carterae.1
MSINTPLGGTTQAVYAINYVPSGRQVSLPEDAKSPMRRKRNCLRSLRQTVGSGYSKTTPQGT